MIKVLKPGFYTSIQDLGRLGSQKLGIPISGGMDHFSIEIANTLLGNNITDAVIEMTMTGPTLEFGCDTLICISGADISPTLNEYPVKLNKIIEIKNGDVLSFGKLLLGFRSYLAVLGGFKTEEVLKSKSMYKGITENFVLTKGDTIKIDTYGFDKINHNASLRVDTSHLSNSVIEVYKGPEFHLLSEEQKQQLELMFFTVAKENNRMAYQLKETLKNNLEPIITSLVLPGTVQLTPSGKLIVLMRDCQTTGGYPRVLQLSEQSINILAQKFTGKQLKFKLIVF